MDMANNVSLDKVLRLEMRILQVVVVLLISILSFFILEMFDRLENSFTQLSDKIENIQEDNDNRDEKLAQLMLQVERRLTTLEVVIDAK